MVSSQSRRVVSAGLGANRMVTRKEFSQDAFRDYIKQLVVAEKSMEDMKRLTGKTEGTLNWYIKTIKEEINKESGK